MRANISTLVSAVAALVLVTAPHSLQPLPTYSFQHFANAIGVEADAIESAFDMWFEIADYVCYLFGGSDMTGKF